MTTSEQIDADADQLGSLSRLQPETHWLRADFPSLAPATIDRSAGIIRGYIVAEKGRFKSRPGEFDDAALDKIVELGNAESAGLKARWTHPSLSGDGLGNFLGRSKSFRRDGDKVRADLHFNRTALEPPAGGGKSRGHYLMDLAESDPAAFGSSLALKADQEARLNSDGTSKKDDKGEELPKLWRPTKLHASDIVDDGDACHTGFLSSTGEVADEVVRQASQLLNTQFAGCDRKTVQARAQAWLSRYLTLRFGEDDMATTAETTTAATTTTGATTTAAKVIPADDKLEERLSAFEERQKLLEAAQAKELTAARTRTVDALIERWESRKDGLGRPDPQVAPFELEGDVNLRTQLLSASAADFDALTSIIDRRPAGIYSGFFSQKMKQPGTGAKTPEVLAAERYAEKANKQLARS